MDLQDVLQETHAILAEELGPGYGSLIGRAVESPEFEDSELAKTVKRCLWRAEGRLRRTPKQRAIAKLTVPLGGQDDPAGDFPNANNYIQLSIDLAEAMDQATSEEQQVWELMCEHYRTTEIARELGVTHQRISRLQSRIADRIEHIFKE